MQLLCNFHKHNIYRFLLFLRKSNYCVGVGREIVTNNPKQKQMTQKIDILMHNLVRIRNVTGIFEIVDFFPESVQLEPPSRPSLEIYQPWHCSESPCLLGLLSGDTSSPAPSKTSSPDIIHLTLCRVNLVWELLLFSPKKREYTLKRLMT